MTKIQRRILHGVGLIGFIGITAVAVYSAPPDLRTISMPWLLVGFVLSGLATTMQALQLSVFLRQEHASIRASWTLWFCSEKAWVNSVVPAKAGTAAGIAVLQRQHGVKWSKYLRFMMLCAGTTVVASLVTLLAFLVTPLSLAVVLAGFCFVACTAALAPVYRISWSRLYALGLIALVNLALLSVGLAACLQGLGQAIDGRTTMLTGVTLNTLSIVSITPGNFGVREAVLAVLAPLLAVDFGIIVQGAACYVILRLVASAGLAMLTRGAAFRH